jgi:transposase-like protein
MSKHRKSWSLSEKTKIVSHYQQHGIAAASRQFEVAFSMIYRWEKQLLSATNAAISPDEYKRLLRENQALKELVAEKELALKIKEELLKKTVLHSKTG